MYEPVVSSPLALPPTLGRSRLRRRGREDWGTRILAWADVVVIGGGFCWCDAFLRVSGDWDLFILFLRLLWYIRLGRRLLFPVLRPLALTPHVCTFLYTPRSIPLGSLLILVKSLLGSPREEGQSDSGACCRFSYSAGFLRPGRSPGPRARPKISATSFLRIGFSLCPPRVEF